MVNDVTNAFHYPVANTVGAMYRSSAYVIKAGMDYFVPNVSKRTMKSLKSI